MFVNVAYQTAGGNTLYAYSDGILIYGGTQSWANGYSDISFPVGSGQVYSVKTLNAGSIITWTECRWDCQSGIWTGVGGGGLGYGQAWYNVTGSRTPNTIYQNTSGKPIQIYIRTHNLTFPNMDISSNCASWTTIANPYVSGSYIIPNQFCYRVISADTFDYWSELR